MQLRAPRVGSYFYDLGRPAPKVLATPNGQVGAWLGTLDSDLGKDANYPQSITMLEITIPTRACPASSVCQDPSLLRELNPGLANDPLLPYQPYLLTKSSGQSDALFQQVCQLPVAERQSLAHLLAQLGDLTLPLAELFERHYVKIQQLPPLPAAPANQSGAAANPAFSPSAAAAVAAKKLPDILGSAVGATGGRAGNFISALEDYQKALLALFEAKQRGASPGTISHIKSLARQRWQILDTQFKRELLTYQGAASRRGNALSNVERGINQALSGRKVQVLRVADVQQLRRLSLLAKSARFVGNGLIVFELGKVANAAHRDHQAGRDWRRTGIVGVAGVAGVYAGGLFAANIALSGLRIALGSTPWGWALLLGTGFGWWGATKGKDWGIKLIEHAYDHIDIPSSFEDLL